MTPLLFALPGNEAMAAALCRQGGFEAGRWELRAFPDSESHVRFLSDPAGREVVLVCSLDRPDAKFVPLCLAACVARELGARRVGLVVPYLAYLRQDARFQPGEGVTARHFARLLGSAVNWLVTVDPHLHRFASLDQVYAIPTRVVHAAPRLAQWIAAEVPRPVLVGPDEESAQWVARVAAAIGCPWITLHKDRHGDRDVTVSVPEPGPWRICTPVLVDDIASTGRTLAAAARIREAGMAAPVCVVVHPLFAGDAYETLLAAGVARIAATNTVGHPSAAIDMAADLAAAARELLAARAG
ncbi:ribose-phosphate pyrophosphokinase [Massilia sp. 9I]|uniref:ribose-phosphate pyrophosphokinase n=1 Tax=Massilia sp. 9I TaxID=2653152 RepID=UPI0012EFE13C|nr:ribose-phosphate pyrophosphokinase [Massilia sp. 9I]VXB98344.1 Ribose-phosphate pyrophosphokinase [Massilia sp. 9I]